MFRKFLACTNFGVRRPSAIFPVTRSVNAVCSHNFATTSSPNGASTSNVAETPVSDDFSTKLSALPQPLPGPRPQVWPYGRDREGIPNPARVTEDGTPIPKPNIVREDLQDYDMLRNNALIEQLINTLMRKGKKAMMRGIMSRALELVQERTSANPIKVVEDAIISVTPIMKCFQSGRGTRSAQVPRPLTLRQGRRLAMVWLDRAVEKRKELSIEERLAAEIYNIHMGTSSVNKMKAQMHFDALKNRANAQIRL